MEHIVAEVAAVVDIVVEEVALVVVRLDIVAEEEEQL